MKVRVSIGLTRNVMATNIMTIQEFEERWEQQFPDIIDLIIGGLRAGREQRLGMVGVYGPVTVVPVQEEDTA